jgi:cell division transport system permease protein
MRISTSIKRILNNTGKQIKRSGWLAWASVMVMTLAFFIGSTFILITYTSNLYLASIENKPHIYVFFNVDTDETKMKQLRDQLLAQPEIESIEYTDKNGALSEFKLVQAEKDPQLAENIREDVLPPSLGIRLYKIDDADRIINQLSQTKANDSDIFAVRYSKESIDTIKSLFYWARLGGGIVILLLMVVIFFFTLLTVEFRTFSRAEEIGIMQLVGGSLWFIRAPFVMEGAFYGLVGALISNTFVFGIGYLVFILNKDSGSVQFIIGVLAGLRWPLLMYYHYALIFIGSTLLGGILGAFNSLIAIRRYIY